MTSVTIHTHPYASTRIRTYLRTARRMTYQRLLMMNEPCITDVAVVEMCASAEVGERAIYRRLLGLPVRGRAGTAADKAIAAWRERERQPVEPTPLRAANGAG